MARRPCTMSGTMFRALGNQVVGLAVLRRCYSTWSKRSLRGDSTAVLARTSPAAGVPGLGVGCHMAGVRAVMCDWM